MNEQLEAQINELIAKLRNDDTDVVEEGKQELVAIGKSIGPKILYNHLEGIKQKELVPVQWEIEEVMEILVPPVVKEEVVDDPTKRELRQSELELVAQSPQHGILLYKSKVDTRWVVMQIDPYTGRLMGKQELPKERGEQLQKQLSGGF